MCTLRRYTVICIYSLWNYSLLVVGTISNNKAFLFKRDGLLQNSQPITTLPVRSLLQCFSVCKSNVNCNMVAVYRPTGEQPKVCYLYDYSQTMGHPTFTYQAETRNYWIYNGM